MTAKILILPLILANYVSYSTGSLNSQAIQLTLSRSVFARVQKDCPEMVHKFDIPREGWKERAKNLARNKIRDLTRFEPDEATVNKYTSWVCSGGGGRHIFNFPTLKTEQGTTFYETDKINEESEESLDVTQVGDMELAGVTSASYYDIKINAVPFLLGCLIGVLVTILFTLRSTQSTIDMKKLRRPEL